MFQRLCSAIVLALAIVSGALVLRTSPTVDAGGRDSGKPVSFYVDRMNSGDTVILGDVPSNRYLLVKDFLAIQSSGSGYFRLLADGTSILPGNFRWYDMATPLSLTTWILVPGGKQLSIAMDGGTADISFLILGELRDAQ